MKTTLTAFFATIIISCSLAQAGTWTTIDKPGANFTAVHGISGDKMVGIYGDESGMHGYLYDGATWTTLAMPGATRTSPQGIDGDMIVGYYHDVSGTHGFLYDGTTWTTLDAPGAFQTIAYDIDAGNIVGSGGVSGFLYDGTTWQTIDAPWGHRTEVRGISGDNMVGNFDSSLNFAYDGTTWTDWTELMMSENVLTRVRGIDGDYIVGYCRDFPFGGWGDLLTGDPPRGFYYDGTTWTTFYAPLGGYVRDVYDIDGDNIVGVYHDGESYRGFIYTIPEPATIGLLTFGGFLALQRKRRSC